MFLELYLILWGIFLVCNIGLLFAMVYQYFKQSLEETQRLNKIKEEIIKLKKNEDAIKKIV